MFKIGDKVAYVKPPIHVNGHRIDFVGTVAFGQTGVITGAAFPDPMYPDIIRYPVLFDGQLLEKEPIQECLRLIEPPKQELGSWAEIRKITNWRPELVQA